MSPQKRRCLIDLLYNLTIDGSSNLLVSASPHRQTVSFYGVRTKGAAVFLNNIFFNKHLFFIILQRLCHVQLTIWHSIIFIRYDITTM
jgi:hypothetical protein